jgi:hypothetical protein
MKHLYVPDFLVQLVLLGCWTSGLPLLASGLSKRKVSWFGSSGCRAAAPVAEAFFSGMTNVKCLPKVVEKDSPEVGANVGDLF